jgi:hypothetical protein
VVNRRLLAAACVCGLAAVPALAQAPARTVRPADVAYVQFVDPGDLSGDAQRKLAAGQQFVVLRGGGTADGRPVDIAGRVPLRLTLQGPSGARRELSSAEVAVVYLARPSGEGWQAPSAAGAAVPATPGQKVFTVPGNRAWTSTLLIFQDGDVVGIRATGQVRLSPGAGDVVPPAGAAGTKPGSNFPMPVAPRGALIGRIDNGPAFMIGARQSMRVAGNGVLYLGVNDDLTSDNGGEFRVTASILPRRR